MWIIIYFIFPKLKHISNFSILFVISCEIKMIKMKRKLFLIEKKRNLFITFKNLVYLSCIQYKDFS